MNNKYYVYLHLDVSNTVFYVGKGAGARSHAKTNRSEAWRKRATEGYTVVIAQDNLTNKAALKLEEELIFKHTATIINRKKSGAIREMEYKSVSELFYLDELSPSGISWKVNMYSGRGGCRLMATKGSPAGNKNTQGWQVKANGVLYYVHRVICLLIDGELCSDSVVDHLDGDHFNNRLDNLKIKSFANNSRNRIFKNTRGLLLGVYEISRPCGAINYEAKWRDGEGKLKSKSFSIKKYGREEAYRLACKTRKEEIEKLKQLGFDYTDRHLLQ